MSEPVVVHVGTRVVVALGILDPDGDVRSQQEFTFMMNKLNSEMFEELLVQVGRARAQLLTQAEAQRMADGGSDSREDTTDGAAAPRNDRASRPALVG